MKKLMIVAMILLVAGIATAEEQTLFGPDMEHGGFGEFSIKPTTVMDQFAFGAAGSGAWVLNRTVSLGFEVNIIPPVFRPQGDMASDVDDIMVAYGGFTVNVGLMSRSAVHPYMGLMVGSGANIYFYDQNDIVWGNSQEAQADAIWVIEPSAGVEFNFTKFMRMNVCAGYRYVGDIESYGYGSSDFSGIYGKLGFKFGSKM